jgi:hypothetical protein
LAADLAVKAAQYDEIVKEKRTDVVKRFEDEIAVLRASEAALADEVATFKVRAPHHTTPHRTTPHHTTPCHALPHLVTPCHALSLVPCAHRTILPFSRCPRSPS